MKWRDLPDAAKKPVLDLLHQERRERARRCGASYGTEHDAQVNAVEAISLAIEELERETT